MSLFHGTLAGKITGMLLEMDNMELLPLLQLHDLVRAHVAEALQVPAGALPPGPVSFPGSAALRCGAAPRAAGVVAPLAPRHLTAAVFPYPLSAPALGARRILSSASIRPGRAPLASARPAGGGGGPSRLWRP